jgi:FKBP-type peptidyl-prolyl cis-trans isomerase
MFLRFFLSFIIVFCSLILSAQIQSTLKTDYKFKIKSNGIGVKFFKKNKKGQLPKISQRAYIKYALYHKKDTSRLKTITSLSDKNFLIGSEEILIGLEQAILLMKVGDSALFKIPPHLAYGDKKTGNILPNSDLYFFVALKQLDDEFFNHNNKDTIIFPDGLKKIVVTETNNKRVQNYERVEINYIGYVYSKKGYRQIFESTKLKKAGIIFQMGTGMLLPGLDEGILSMNIGEKVTFIVPPHLGYMNRQVGKILPNTTLYFDIEVVNSYSPFFETKDKVVKKLKNGTKYYLVKDTIGKEITIEDLVQFDYMAYYKDRNGNSVLFDNSFKSDQAMLIRPGTNSSLPDIDNVLLELTNFDQVTVEVPYCAYKEHRNLRFIPDTLPFYYDLYISNVSKYPFMELFRNDTIKQPNKLKYIEGVVGMGEDSVKKGSLVKLAYTVYFYNEKGIRHIVDGTRENNKRIEVTVGSGTSVKGLEEGIIGMKNTGSRRIFIPSEMAYGKEGVPKRGIPGNIELIFDVEHLEILKK